MHEFVRKTEIHDDTDPTGLHERTRQETLRYLDNPSFNDIIKVASECRILTKAAYQEFDALEGRAKYDRLRAIFDDINPRNMNKHGFVERNQLKIEVPPPLLEALRAAADSVGMLEELSLPDEGNFKLAVVHGGAGKTPLLRAHFLLDGMQNNPNLSAEYVAMLGIDRPVDDAERKRGGDYAKDATTESELMDAAAVEWLTQHGLEDVLQTKTVHEAKKQGGYVSGMTYKIIAYDLAAAKADGRLGANFPEALFVVEAPIDATRLTRQRDEGKDVSNTLYKTRADTQDTLDIIAQTAGIEPDDRVLSISHQPVLTAQDLITRTEFVKYNAEVTSAGYHSAALSNNPGLLLSELCKVVDTAGNLYDEVTDSANQLPLAA